MVGLRAVLRADPGTLELGDDLKERVSRLLDAEHRVAAPFSGGDLPIEGAPADLEHGRCLVELNMIRRELPDVGRLVDEWRGDRLPRLRAE